VLSRGCPKSPFFLPQGSQRFEYQCFIFVTFVLSLCSLCSLWLNGTFRTVSKQSTTVEQQIKTLKDRGKEIDFPEEKAKEILSDINNNASK